MAIFSEDLAAKAIQLGAPPDRVKHWRYRGRIPDRHLNVTPTLAAWDVIEPKRLIKMISIISLSVASYSDAAFEDIRDYVWDYAVELRVPVSVSYPIPWVACRLRSRARTTSKLFRVAKKVALP